MGRRLRVILDVEVGSMSSEPTSAQLHRFLQPAFDEYGITLHVTQVESIDRDVTYGR